MAGSPRRSQPLTPRQRFGAVAAVAAAMTLSGLTPAPVAAGERAEAVSQPSPTVVRLIERRQAELRRMAGAMRVIGRFLKAEGANVADVGAAAESLRAVAAGFNRDLFPEGSAVGVGPSAARPEIWQEWDLFTERTVELQASAGRLAAAAATGNTDAVRAAIVDVAQACSTCHELFRRKQP